MTPNYRLVGGLIAAAIFSGGNSYALVCSFDCVMENCALTRRMGPPGGGSDHDGCVLGGRREQRAGEEVHVVVQVQLHERLRIRLQ